MNFARGEEPDLVQGSMEGMTRFQRLRISGSNDRMWDMRGFISAGLAALKNDRKVGEGRDGYLVLRETPAEAGYADFARETVARENEARKRLFQEKAAIEGKTEKEYAKEFALRAREASYPGEWVQMEDGAWKKK